MKQTLLCLTLINFSICILYGAATNSHCGDDWVAYKDEKCFKLIKIWVTHNQAEAICNRQRLQTDSSVPTLVSIKSAAEQEYLTKFVFDTSGVKNNVWIGAKRMEDGNQVVWNDGSILDFTNWAEGSPTEDIGRDCVEMQSSFTRKFYNSDSNLSSINGKWKDVTCEAGNYVLCQMNQTWTFLQLQKTLLDTRKELKDSFEDVTKKLHSATNQLNDTRKELEDTRNQLDGIQRNPVPIEFIYTQLPGQPEPKSLWSMVEWKDVTSDYAGLFFRAEGGGSAAFGTLQNGNAPMRYIDQFTVETGSKVDQNPLQIPSSGWSGYKWLAGASGGSLWATFHASGNDGEVRPVNKAVRIWKRTN